LCEVVVIRRVYRESLILILMISCSLSMESIIAIRL
jgi:hypothetical protein